MFFTRDLSIKFLLAALSLHSTFSANAAISLDRTRAVFNGAEKSMVMNISNDNTQLPYLAQAWLENAKQEKITTGPLVVTPPVQRLEPGAKSMIRVSTTPDVAKLPQDRESLFYFSLREIPPKSDKPNVLQIALQTKIKLFYRPKSIEPKQGSVWQEKIELVTTKDGYRIENPTPYYITIIGLDGTEKDSKQGKFESVMLAPKSSETVKTGKFTTPWLTYINDYGGRPSLKFKCVDSRCSVDK